MRLRSLISAAKIGVVFQPGPGTAAQTAEIRVHGRGAIKAFVGEIGPNFKVQVS